MKKGLVINGYRILRDFSTAGGGLSKWSFAEKSGKEFFIKEFLSPTYPDEKAPGSEETKIKKRKRCYEFENHHQKLFDVISPICSEGGNLIATIDFFRVGAKYYKITEKIDVTGITPGEISLLDEKKKLIVLKTVAHSLEILHRHNIVHGDLKPDNILIKQTLVGGYTAKLIDFDNSYFSSNPPVLLEEIVGDMVYYSPELALYVKGSETVKPKDLQVKSDIFALGLVFTQYLTGDLPNYDSSKFAYAHQAVLGGEKLKIGEMVGLSHLRGLLENMLGADIDSRPNIKEVFNTLKSPSKKETASSPVHSTGKLKIKMGGSSKEPDLKLEELVETNEDKKFTGKLKIKMG